MPQPGAGTAPEAACSAGGWLPARGRQWQAQTQCSLCSWGRAGGSGAGRGKGHTVLPSIWPQHGAKATTVTQCAASGAGDKALTPGELAWGLATPFLRLLLEGLGRDGARVGWGQSGMQVG